MTTTLAHLIADWSNAAEDEAFDREYFYAPHWFSRVQSGQKTLIIGRKGTGKSAIARRLAQGDGASVLGQAVPFETLDPQRFGFSSETGYERETLVRVFKYVVLRAACEAYADSKQAFRSKGLLEKALGQKLDDYLKQPLFERIRRLRIDGPGFGIEVGADRASTSPHALLSERTEACIEFLGENLFGTTVRIVFDALDSGWIEACRDGNSARYVRKIGALIAATVEIKNQFREMGRKLYPFVFCRGDIFSQVANAQMPNWRESHGEYISWSTEDLRGLMVHRIVQTARALEPKASERSALDALFRNQAGDLFDFNGTKRRMKFMDYILDFSIGRPRDVVVYLAKAAQTALDSRQAKIRKADIVDTIPRYGQFLREEIDGELGAEYSGIRRLLNGIRATGKSEMRFDEFVEIVRARLEKDMPLGDVNILAERLFELGVVGNTLPDGGTAFAVRDQSAEFDELLPIKLHPCYAAALNVPA